MNRFPKYLLLLLLFITTVTNQHVYGQDTTGKTLAAQLREFSDKYKLKISFSPSITDHIYPTQSAQSSTHDPVEALTELLNGSGMTFKQVGITYTIIRDPHSEPITIPIKKNEPQKIIEPQKDTLTAKREPLGSIAMTNISLFELKIPPKKPPGNSYGNCFTLGRCYCKS